MKKTKIQSGVAAIALVAMTFWILPAIAATNISGGTAGNSKWAEDVDGGLINLAPVSQSAGDVGVFVDEANMKITGKMWSENLGWIEMEPGSLEGGGDEGVTLTSNGTAPVSGVYIDSEGYFHGVAWSENYGAMAFGDHMALNSASSTYEDVANKSVYWAKSSVSPSSGYWILSGKAWSEQVGWIQFEQWSTGQPTARNVIVLGTPADQRTLTGDYIYEDADGDAEATSTFRWLSSATFGGQYTEVVGATSSTYQLQVTDVGRYVKFEVTPVAASGGSTIGSAVVSHVVGPVEVNTGYYDHSGTGGDYGASNFNFGTTGVATFLSSINALNLASDQKLDVSGGIDAAKLASTSINGTDIKTVLENLGATGITTVVDAVQLDSPLGDDITISSGTLEVAIPDDTIVYGPPDWDGTLSPPVEVTGQTNISGFSLSNGAVVSFGGPSGVPLVFDNPIKIIVPSASGTPLYSVDGTTWTEITTECDDPDNPTNLTAPNECYYKSGNNTVILTYHATNFGDAEPTNTANDEFNLEVTQGGRDLKIVDATGTEIGGTPVFTMNSATVSFLNQDITGTLGTADQQIFVYDYSDGSAGWDLTLDGTSAVSETWTGSNYSMDYNDPDTGGAGQLTIDPSVADTYMITLYHAGAQVGEVETKAVYSTNLNLGDPTQSFDQTGHQAATLLQSSSGSPALGYRIYSVEGIGLSQMVPSTQPSDTYTVNMTLTIS